MSTWAASVISHVINLTGLTMSSNLKLIEINMSSLSEFEQQQIVADNSQDPLDLYIQKVEALADLLNCSEQDAEHIILNRVHVVRRKTLTLHK